MKTDYMKTDEAGLLLIDDAQDLQTRKMSIIVNIATKNPGRTQIYIAGDYLQTLFLTKDDQKDNALDGFRSNIKKDYSDVEYDSLDAHAMNIFKRIETHHYFDLSKCVRCPRAHIEFNNLIMKNIQAKHGLPSMQYDHKNGNNLTLICNLILSCISELRL